MREREKKYHSGRIRSQWLGHVPVMLVTWSKVGTLLCLTQSVAAGPLVSEHLH